MRNFVSKSNAHYLIRTASRYRETIVNDIMKFYKPYMSVSANSELRAMCSGSAHSSYSSKYKSGVNFNISGETDIITDTHIIELKFAKQFQATHYLQLLMYTILFRPK